MLNISTFDAKIFERFRAIFIEQIGLRSLLRPSFNRLGVRRSIVSKSDMIPFNDRGISLIELAISDEMVSH